MPRLKDSPWRAYRPEVAPLAPAEHELLRRYLAWRRLHTSAALVRREELWITRWICWCGARGTTVAQATEDDALALSAEWDGWHWTASPRQHYISCCRAFYTYLLARGLAARNPWALIRGPRPREYSPPVLSPAEIVRLEDALRRPSWRDVRDRAVICVLTASACRISDALRLDMGDLDLEGRRFYVRQGKGGRDRTCLLSTKAVEALRLYLRAARPALTDRPSGPVFLGARGGRLQGEIVREALRRACDRAGLQRHVWPHLLRHSTATEFLDGGAGLEQVQALLGHRSITSTRRYVRVAQGRLRQRYDQVIERRGDRTAATRPAASAANAAAERKNVAGSIGGLDR